MQQSVPLSLDLPIAESYSNALAILSNRSTSGLASDTN